MVDDVSVGQDNNEAEHSHYAHVNVELSQDNILDVNTEIEPTVTQNEALTEISSDDSRMYGNDETTTIMIDGTTILEWEGGEAVISPTTTMNLDSSISIPATSVTLEATPSLGDLESTMINNEPMVSVSQHDRDMKMTASHIEQTGTIEYVVHTTVENMPLSDSQVNDEPLGASNATDSSMEDELPDLIQSDDQYITTEFVSRKPLEMMESEDDIPTASPVDLPTASPVDLPTASPVDIPTASPVDLPTASPVDIPTASPVDLPTASPVEQLPESTEAPDVQTKLLTVDDNNNIVDENNNNAEVWKMAPGIGDINIPVMDSTLHEDIPPSADTKQKAPDSELLDPVDDLRYDDMMRAEIPEYEKPSAWRDVVFTADYFISFLDPLLKAILNIVSPYYCIPHTNVLMGGKLWFSRRYAASADESVTASADTSSFSR